ncbi:MAG: ISNCY family transposase [bacterium]|nr:ISNCY family transposase [bacterium]
MLTLRNDQLPLWAVFLPENATELPEDLQKISDILDDPIFMAPYIANFNTRIGRPTIPVDTLHRLMFLKHAYGLSYRALVERVEDSITWRIFCRVEKLPHHTTLVKLDKRYGSSTVEELNKKVLLAAKEKKVLTGRKMRVDTTVVEADIHYPTDISLLHDGIKAITRSIKRIKAAGAAQDERFTDHTRKAKKILLGATRVCRKRLKSGAKDVKAAVKQMQKLAEDVSSAAQRVIDATGHKANETIPPVFHNARKMIERTKAIIDQTEQVISGNYHIENRIVSLHDTDARPIVKGKTGKPVEFGEKVLIQENEKGIVTSYEVYDSNPNDDTLLKPALDKHVQIFGKAPSSVATDRGFSSVANERMLQEAGVKKISLPRKGKKSKARQQHERQSWFKRLQRFRAGGEATISYLKRRFGLRRSLYHQHEGMKRWVGHGIMVMNLIRIAAML